VIAAAVTVRERGRGGVPRRADQMLQDPPNRTRGLNERDQPKPAATTRARQYVEPPKMCRINCAHSQFDPGRTGRVAPVRAVRLNVESV
jgi:hypothetical protein